MRREILPLEGLSAAVSDDPQDVGLGPLQYAFPNNRFPTGAIHEFLSTQAEDTCTAAGFVAGIASRLMHPGKPVVWIAASPVVFPHALKPFGIEPHNVIFLIVKNPKQLLWATEEALKCAGLAAVIAEPATLDFTASRRLQLAVEHSRVTGFILRKDANHLQTTACITRWRIKHLSSALGAGVPGVGHPRWQVELLRVRNGKPGSWNLEWVNGSLRPVSKLAVVCNSEVQKKSRIA